MKKDSFIGKLEKILGEENIKSLKSVTLKAIFTGEVFKIQFFREQIYLLILLGLISFFYIDNRFYCETQKLRVIELTEKIEDLKYESLTISAQLMNISRQSNVIKLLKENNVQLHGTETPPVVITVKKEEPEN